MKCLLMVTERRYTEFVVPLMQLLRDQSLAASSFEISLKNVHKSLKSDCPQPLKRTSKWGLGLGYDNWFEEDRNSR